MLWAAGRPPDTADWPTALSWKACNLDMIGRSPVPVQSAGQVDVSEPSVGGVQCWSHYCSDLRFERPCIRPGCGLGLYLWRRGLLVTCSSAAGSPCANPAAFNGEAQWPIRCFGSHAGSFYRLGYPIRSFYGCSSGAVRGINATEHLELHFPHEHTVQYMCKQPNTVPVQQQ